jgi:hypothetical protein
LAKITIVGQEGGVVTVGAERVTLEPGQSVGVERTERRTTHKPIFVPDPLRPAAQLVVRIHDESAIVAALSDEELARFGEGEALALELRGTLDLHLAELDQVAEQADERGVEMIVRLRRDAG